MSSATNRQSLAQTLLDEVTETRRAVETLRQFADVLAAPKEEGLSPLQRWTDVLEMLVDGQMQVMTSLQNLHKIVLEPGVALALRRAVEEA